MSRNAARPSPVGRRLISAAGLALILLVVPSPARPAQEPDVTPPLPELPARVPLELEEDPPGELLLRRMGSCCHTSDFTSEPPPFVREVPPAEGIERRFAVVELAESKIVLSLEVLGEDHSSGKAILVRVDLDQDFDLTNDSFYVADDRASIGPLPTAVRTAAGTHPYALTVRYFAHAGDVDFLWYRRAGALVGTFGGRRIAVIDDDTDGRYDGPEDVVVADLDGDGSLDGGHGGRERLRRHQPIPWGDAFLSIREVDPVAGTLTIDRAPEIDAGHTVVDAATGNRVPGARITFHPGGFSAVSDARGRAVVRRPAGEPTRVSAVAGGYWSTVYGPGQRAGADAGTILLEPGPCVPERMRWCGRETLAAGSMERSRLDLDSGVVGYRARETPGPIDLGLYMPPSGLLLQAERGAAFAFLGAADFDALGPEDLRELPFGKTETMVPAGAPCGGQAPHGAEVQLLPGTVLGVRTAEGRMGKVRVDSCALGLDLSWVIYEDPGPGS